VTETDVGQPTTIAGVPSRTGFVQVPGGRLAFDVAGEGPAIVLSHAGVADRRMWDDQWAAFAAGHQVIRYDIRGFGDTTSEDVAFSVRRDILDLMDHLGLSHAALVGVSLGGQISIDLAIERPDRVSALVAVAPGLSGFEGADSPDEQVVSEEIERLTEAGDFEAVVELEVRMWTDGPGQPTDRVDPAVRQRMIRMGRRIYERHPPEGEGRPQRLQPPAFGRLSEVRAPTLIVLGDLDASVILTICDALAAGVSGSRKIVFPGTAHMLTLEKPSEFAQVVLDFLAEHGA
jgi:3-oxoadipate enol-lactonase